MIQISFKLFQEKSGEMISEGQLKVVYCTFPVRPEPLSEDSSTIARACEGDEREEYRRKVSDYINLERSNDIVHADHSEAISWANKRKEVIIRCVTSRLDSALDRMKRDKGTLDLADTYIIIECVRVDKKGADALPACKWSIKKSELKSVLHTLTLKRIQAALNGYYATAAVLGAVSLGAGIAFGVFMAAFKGVLVLAAIDSSLGLAVSAAVGLFALVVLATSLLSMKSPKNLKQEENTEQKKGFRFFKGKELDDALNYQASELGVWV